MIEPENVKRYERELTAMVIKASGDPESFAQVSRLLADAVQMLRASANVLRADGYSDSDIGRALGVTRQAVRQRWPH